MKFTPQRMKFLHSIDGVNYSLDFVREHKGTDPGFLPGGGTIILSWKAKRKGPHFKKVPISRRNDLRERERDRKNVITFAAKVGGGGHKHLLTPSKQYI